jgi:hypothetical protein
VKNVLLPVCLAFATGRLIAADFTVTNSNNSGPGSLYQAITDANIAPGADRILFNIPGPGVHKIDVSQKLLPAVVESLVIDGYSQPGAKPNSLAVGDNAVILIQIDGGGLFFNGTRNGFALYPGSGPSNYLIRGLCLTGFRSAAITAGAVDSAVVVGNFIGLLPDGETFGSNGFGVGHVTQLGGTDPASRNVISANKVGFVGAASPFPGTSVLGATVQGNYIGTNASGTKAIPNSLGIGLESAFNDTGESPCNGTQKSDVDLSKTFIGGTAPGAPNLISGNWLSGIELGRFDLCQAKPVDTRPVRANGARVQGNWIGLQADGVSALPNGDGIVIRAGSNNLIGGTADVLFAGNTIAYNGTGVIVTGGNESRGNQIAHNSIFRNTKLGINLGDDAATPNDASDTDAGPNGLQNFPLINSVTNFSGSPHSGPFARVTGTLNSTPNSTFRLEFFISGEAGPSGFGQGEVDVASRDVTTDANGNASFDVNFATDPGRSVFTATAMDAAGNTSEFSPAFPPAAQLLNLSTRTPVGTDANVLIGGFIISGTEGKKVMLRGLGPSLGDAGVHEVLADPTLELHDSTGTLLAHNDNWQESQQAAEISATGIAPTRDSEAAIIATLAAGQASQGGTAYTAILAGQAGTAGIGLLEIYDLAADANSKLANISTRGYVGTGDNLMIAGTIPGPAGRSPGLVLIRALGPSLAAHGVSGTLQDPGLELHNANGATIVDNDNWRDSLFASQIAATGIPPTDDRESAIFFPVRPGTYTAIVRGVKGTTGVALVEVYAVN